MHYYFQGVMAQLQRARAAAVSGPYSVFLNTHTHTLTHTHTHTPTLTLFCVGPFFPLYLNPFIQSLLLLLNTQIITSPNMRKSPKSMYTHTHTHTQSHTHTVTHTHIHTDVYIYVVF